MAEHGRQPDALDFIDWAAGAYPADRYILVLWDHGGYNGVCFDETASYDSLTIHEVNDALFMPISSATRASVWTSSALTPA